MTILTLRLSSPRSAKERRCRDITRTRSSFRRATRRTRSSTTTALEECVIPAVTTTAMLAALRSEPKFSAFFVAYLLNRNSRIEGDLIDQLFNSSEKRLARLLLLLANFGKDSS